MNDLPILHPHHLQVCNDALKRCSDIQSMIEKCKLARIPCEELEQANQLNAEIAKGIKAQFFPDSN